MRSPARIAELRALGATPLIADLDRPASLKRLAGIGSLVLHFAPPQEKGARDRRTQALLATFGQAKILPQRLRYISTSGVYGDCAGAWVAEERPLRAQTPRAQRRADAEKQLRRFGSRNRSVVSILRAPGIYAGDRLPLARLHAGLPCCARARTSIPTTSTPTIWPPSHAARLRAGARGGPTTPATIRC